jgi:hypothetical protein
MASFVLTVVDGKLKGEDYVGGKHTGNPTEQPNGTIKLLVFFEVRPGRGLVQGPARSARRRPMTRTTPDSGDGPMFGAE